MTPHFRHCEAQHAEAIFSVDEESGLCVTSRAYERVRGRLAIPTDHAKQSEGGKINDLTFDS